MPGCPSQPLMIARSHQPARPPTGHHNWRRPDSVIVALQFSVLRRSPANLRCCFGVEGRRMKYVMLPKCSTSCVDLQRCPTIWSTGWILACAALI